MRCVHPGKWKIQDLQITVLEPFKRLRFLYNGFLRKIASGDVNVVEHVQFNFM